MGPPKKGLVGSVRTELLADGEISGLGYGVPDSSFHVHRCNTVGASAHLYRQLPRICLVIDCMYDSTHTAPTVCMYELLLKENDTCWPLLFTHH
jgi:hypothetical protein